MITFSKFQKKILTNEGVVGNHWAEIALLKD